MKVLVLYRPNSEHESSVQDFVRELKHRSNKDVELVDLNTRDGAATASLYDVMQYPAFLALSNDGSLLRSWEGEAWPLISEVSYYIDQDPHLLASDKRHRIKF